jgi:hypothetical protein
MQNFKQRIFEGPFMSKTPQARQARKSKVKLPRYGFMNSTQDGLEADPSYLIPGAFETSATPSERTKKWQLWTASQINLLESCFGPVWGDPAWNRRWLEITKTDLRLMRYLCKTNWVSPIPALPSVMTKHSELFQSEDDGHVAKTVVKYVSVGTFTNADLALLLSTESTMLGNYLGTVHLTIKRAFQRPRPHQAAAYLLQKHEAKDYQFEGARSAWTPSFLSGHALENGLSFLGIQQAFLMKSACTTIIRTCQYMITDVGDRRVFAGVHYPSDSLASWLVLANILNFYPALHSLRSTLSSQLKNSPVYKAIDAENTNVYKQGLSELSKALRA